jgi:hypothetical protein
VFDGRADLIQDLDVVTAFVTAMLAALESGQEVD